MLKNEQDVSKVLQVTCFACIIFVMYVHSL